MLVAALWQLARGSLQLSPMLMTHRTNGLCADVQIEEAVLEPVQAT